jgi:hypothetical protein
VDSTRFMWAICRIGNGVFMSDVKIIGRSLCTAMYLPSSVSATATLMSLVPACLGHTKAADTTTCENRIC